MSILSSFPLVNLWNKRSLIFTFSLFEIKLRYKGTYLGLIWTILEPLFMFSLLYVVFTSIRGDSSREDFAIYLITGVMLYHLFMRGSMNSLTVLRQNLPILTSLNIRRELFPVVSAYTVGLLMLVEITLLFALMVVFNFYPPWTIIFLPIVLGLFLFLMLGLSYLLSIAYVFIKDIQPIWGVFSYALIFISPIFWYLDSTEGILLEIQKINPLGQLIELTHQILVFGNVPPIGDWIYTSVLIFGLFFVGYALFQKFEKKIAEKI